LKKGLDKQALLCYNKTTKRKEVKTMEIRYATAADAIHVIRSLQNKNIAYNTTAQAKEDITNGRLLVAEIDGRLVGSIAIVPEPNYNYTALKRLCVYNKKDHGKGIANELIKTAAALVDGPVGGTPWNTNPVTTHLFEKNGFVYQYTFSEKYQFFLKNS